jgi:hypothetical protein
MATATHIGGSIYAGRSRGGGLQPITLDKAARTYLWLKREALKLRSFDPALAEALDAEAQALAEAHDQCAAWRRAAGFADPYAADRPCPAVA